VSPSKSGVRESITDGLSSSHTVSGRQPGAKDAVGSARPSRPTQCARHEPLASLGILVWEGVVLYWNILYLRGLETTEPRCRPMIGDVQCQDYV